MAAQVGSLCLLQKVCGQLQAGAAEGSVSPFLALLSIFICPLAIGVLCQSVSPSLPSLLFEHNTQVKLFFYF